MCSVEKPEAYPITIQCCRTYNWISLCNGLSSLFKAGILLSTNTCYLWQNREVPFKKLIKQEKRTSREFGFAVAPRLGENATSVTLYSHRLDTEMNRNSVEEHWCFDHTTMLPRLYALKRRISTKSLVSSAQEVDIADVLSILLELSVLRLETELEKSWRTVKRINCTRRIQSAGEYRRIQRPTTQHSQSGCNPYRGCTFNG